MSTHNFWFDPPTQPLPCLGGQRPVGGEEPTPLFDQTIQTLTPTEPRAGADHAAECVVDPDSAAGRAIGDLHARASTADLDINGPTGREVLALVHRWLHAIGIDTNEPRAADHHQHNIHGE